LASQIDRLEGILAGLPESLGQTVAEAVQDAVGKAVELAVREVLTSPEILRVLRAQTAPNPEPAKSVQDGSLTKTFSETWQRTRDNAAWAGARVGEQATAVGSCLSRACAWVGGCLQAGWAWASAACGRAAAGVAVVCNTLPALLLMLSKYRKPLLIAVTVGLVVGLASYWAGPVISAMLSGLAGFVGALVINRVRRLRTVMEAVRLPGNWAS
jgi:hypothetical protein